MAYATRSRIGSTDAQRAVAEVVLAALGTLAPDAVATPVPAVEAELRR